ncbi:uncharacterized protein P3T18_002067 [Paraburkholderia sp. GAS199]|uniref:UPF0149 family protein n=1 Tax=Paraburkholderia sp. GAS199 TaxID=3035126 RepID=UPI003D23F74D
MSKSKLNPAELTVPLSEKEFEELDEFLISDATSEETLTIESLDGYLTALAIGPATVPPSHWLPGVWGPSEDDTPAFDSVDQAQRILGLIIRHQNGIIASLENDPDGFEPVFGFSRVDDSEREYIDGEAWAMGFVQALARVRRDWQPLLDDEQARHHLRPLHLMGAIDLTDEEAQLVETPEQQETLTREIPGSIAAIYRYWQPHCEAAAQSASSAAQRTEPKVGRNDPCPCGSGKKFKKCCGLAQ